MRMDDLRFLVRYENSDEKSEISSELMMKAEQTGSYCALLGSLSWKAIRKCLKFYVQRSHEYVAGRSWLVVRDWSFWRIRLGHKSVNH